MENNKRTKKDAGQEQMHHYFYNVQQELMRQSGSVPGYTVGMMPVPGSSSSSGTSGFVPSTTAPGVPIISHPPAITYRPIRPSDLEVLQEIHEALFPIKYEAEFFMNVVHGKGIISWAAVDSNRSDLQCDELIGFVTARVVTATEGEESDMLGYEMLKTERSLIYILTLGVIKPYRNCGIASALVWEVIHYASRISTCRAVYLHVISYNQSAIHFYQKNMFHCLRRLHNFYCIEGRYYDAYLYVYYVNGGRSPCSAVDLLTVFTGYVRSFFTSMASRLF